MSPNPAARDNAQGAAARTKDVLGVDITPFHGDPPTTPLVDLLNLSGPAQPGTMGLGDLFALLRAGGR